MSTIALAEVDVAIYAGAPSAGQQRRYGTPPRLINRFVAGTYEILDIYNMGQPRHIGQCKLSGFIQLISELSRNRTGFP